MVVLVGVVMMTVATAATAAAVGMGVVVSGVTLIARLFVVLP